MGLDPASQLPPFRQIAGDLRRAIAAGRYKAGDQIPSITAIAAQYEVAPNTAKDARRLLRDEGLITIWQGKGAFVREPGDGTADPDVTQIQAALDRLAERVEDLEVRADEGGLPPAAPREHPGDSSGG